MSPIRRVVPHDSPLPTQMVRRSLDRRLVAPHATAVIKIGQLAVLQLLDGGSGASQLTAHLVLAPIASASNGQTAMSNYSNTDFRPSTLDAKATQRKSFMLAPSSTPNGIKLQMVEAPPSHLNTSEENWKYVQFQATLSTDSDNKPHLYCAVVEPSNSLQMELCDEGEEAKRSISEEKTRSRIFLYDSITGEVVPSQLDATSSSYEAEDDKQASTEAVAKAIAQLSDGETPSTADKRQTTDQSHRRSVKLVFFADEAAQTTETAPAGSSGPTLTNDADKPPLLRHDHTS